MKDIFIGVDGGGTKSKVRVEDSAGNCLGQAVSGPANIRLSVDQSWESIYHALNEIFLSAKLSLDDPQYQFHLGLGLAGCEVIKARDAFLKRAHSFSTLHLVSDAHVACLGAHQSQDGAIIIVGTGVIGYQIQAGVNTKVGGWGFPHDDEGGGAWLGLEACRLTFQWLDHRVEKSPLVDDIFSYFDRDVEHFIAWANHANSSEFAKLAPLVINHCQQEEVAAVRLMKKAAHEIDRVWVALKKSQTKPLPCCLFGGIAPFVEPWLGEELQVNLVPRQGDANAGAIRLIRELIKERV